MPTKLPRNTKAKKTQPESAKAWVPDKRTPIVQPSDVIDPQPRKTPPSRAVEPFFGVNEESLKRPPANAAANEVPTKPRISQPLFVIVSVTTATQPAIRSSPTNVSGPI